MVAVTAQIIPRLVPLKYLFPVRTLLPFVPWIVIISAVSSASQFDAATLGVWLAIHTVTLFVAGFSAMAVSALMGRAGTTSVPAWWVLGMGAFVGAIKAFGTIAVEEALGLADAPPEATAARALGAVVVGVWLVTIFSWGKTALDSVQQARDEVIRRNVATRLAEELETPRTEVSQSLAAISALRQDIARPTTDTQPADIRAVVDGIIRPLSRVLWSVEVKRYPDIRLVALYRVALQSFSIRAWLIALVWATTTFTALAAPTGIVHAATYSVMAGLVAWGVFSVIRLGWTESITLSVIVVTLGSVGSVVVGYLLAGIILDTGAQPGDVVTLVSGVVWMVFVVLGSSILTGVHQLTEVIRRDLNTPTTQDLIHERATDDTLTASTKTLATRLHGSVQSSLLGLAAALDRGTITQAEVDKTLSGIIHDLELLGDTDALPGDHPDRGADSVASLVKQWQGIVDVAIDNTSRLTIEQLVSARPEVVDIIREALTNAHRHGHASRVTIEATTDPSGDVTLRVTDNGYGPTTGTPGLGSTLLDTWTQSRWSLRQATDGGSVLVATITPPQ